MSFTQLRVFLSFLDAFLNFLLHFLPSGNSQGYFDFFFFYQTTHRLVERRVIQPSDLLASSKVFLTISNHFFYFSSYFSSSSSSLYILFNSPTSIPLQKLSAFLSFPHNLIFSFQNFFLSLPNSFFSMAPKSQKSSYVLSSDVFNLTRQNAAMRLNEAPSLTHRPYDHLPKSARTGLVCFSSFFSFSHFALFFHFNIFLDI